jgi:hypothetical protein
MGRKKTFHAIVSVHGVAPGPDGTHAAFQQMIATVIEPIVSGYFPDAHDIKAITMPDGVLHVGYFEEKS